MSYASDVYSDVKSMSQDPALLADLSPAARATLGLVDFAITQSLKGKSPAEIAQDVADQAIGAGLQAGQQLLAQIASSISADLGAAAGAVLPYVGWIVQMLLNAKPAGNQASVASYTAGALEVYEPIGAAGHSIGFGTGPGGAIMPVDLFIKKELAAKSGERRFLYTSLGQALAAITEYDGELDRARSKLGSKVGVPLARRMQFRQLRRRIVDSYNRLSDGGAALWTIYLDLLRHEFDCGHLTPTYARYLSVFGGAYNAWKGNAERDGSCMYASWGMGQTEYHDHELVTRDLLTNGIASAQKLAVERASGAWTFPPLFDTRGRQQIYDTVQGWRQTLTPKYVQFESLEQKVLAYLKQQQKPKMIIKLPAKIPVMIAKPLIDAAAKQIAQGKALQKAVGTAAANWTKQAGGLPATPHPFVPQAVPVTPNPTAPIPTIVPGLSFEITPATQARAAGIGQAAPVLGAAAALALLL